MDGIRVPRLFKYVKAKTAITILEKKTLQWSVPDSFNDPFEFKSPFAYGFEWDEMAEVALREVAKILTQAEEPSLSDGNPVAPKIKERRKECKGKDPNEIIELVRPILDIRTAQSLQKGDCCLLSLCFQLEERRSIDPSSA
jgi:hypothetical protein